MDAIVYDKVGKEAEKIRNALYGIYPQETITDSAIASFDDGVDGMPVQKLVASIEPVQAGSGGPSPDNVRPISGFTVANVTRTGKNLFDKAKPLTSGLINGSGEVVENVSYQHSDYYTKLTPATAYIFSGGIVDAGTYNSIAFYDENKNFLSQIVPPTSGVGASFTTPSNCTYIRFNTANSNNINLDTIQLELGSTATDYEEYRGNQIPVTFPAEAGTVYGGTLTINPDRTGTLTVDTRHATIAYSGSQSSPTTEVTMQLGALAKGFKLSDNGLKCNRFQPSNYTTAQGFYVFMPNAALVRFTSPDPIADWRAYFQANPTEVTYKLATPSVYSLTASEVSGILTTLYGTNNIWSDTGNIKKLTYRADLGKYIDSRITTAVANALNA